MRTITVSTEACIETAIMEGIIENADVVMENVGIGPYEFWGMRGFDNRMAPVAEGGELMVRIPVAMVLADIGPGPWFGSDIFDLKTMTVNGSDTFDNDVEVEVEIKTTIMSVDGDDLNIKVEWY